MGIDNVASLCVILRKDHRPLKKVRRIVSKQNASKCSSTVHLGLATRSNVRHKIWGLMHGAKCQVWLGIFTSGVTCGAGLIEDWMKGANDTSQFNWMRRLFSWHSRWLGWFTRRFQRPYTSKNDKLIQEREITSRSTKDRTKTSKVQNTMEKCWGPKI